MTIQQDAKLSSAYSLSGMTVSQAQTSAAYRLDASTQQSVATSSVAGLAVYTTSAVTTSTGFSIAIYKTSISKTSYGWALEAYKNWLGSYSARSVLASYVTSTSQRKDVWAVSAYSQLAGSFSAQWALSKNTVSNTAYSTQYRLDTKGQLVVGYSAQWVLDATTQSYGWQVNLATNAVSKIEGLAFNSLSGTQGADATGIYVLSGTTDNGAEIDSIIESGKLDFGDASLKNLTDYYAGVEGGKLKLTVTTESHSVSYHTTGTTQLRTTKVRLAKGAKGKYWRFRLTNVSGSSVKVDEQEIIVEAQKRRV